jgi:hypothetical protein
MAKGYAARDVGTAEGRGYGHRQKEVPWTTPGPYEGRGPRGYRRSDERIFEDVAERLMEHGQIDASEMEVEVRDGEVALRGYAVSRYAKRAAEDVAESVVGVKDVRNELQVRDQQKEVAQRTLKQERDQRRRQDLEQERQRWQQEQRGRAAGAGYLESQAYRETDTSRRRDERERGRGREVGSANLAVFGIYRDRSAVEQAVEALQSSGFRNTDISVLFSDNNRDKGLCLRKGDQSARGVTVGAGSGIVVGGVLGWLAGIGLLAVPGIGPFIAAGPIVSALADKGIAGTVGSIAGVLIGMGMPEYEAGRYEGRVKGGHVLLSVHSNDRDWARRAESILDRTGAEDIRGQGRSPPTLR